MVCSSCGDVLQPSAVSCINVSCANHGLPLTPAEQHANRPRPAAPTAPIRPLHALANATVACVAATALSSAIAIPLGRLGDPAPLTPAWTTAYLLIVALAVAAATCFVTWLFQARRNLDALPTANPFWPKSWTIGVWFIPFGNAFMPALVVADVAEETVADRDDPRRRRLALLAKLWWISVVVACALLYPVAVRRTSGEPLVLSVPPDLGGDLTLSSPDVTHPASAVAVVAAVAGILVSAATCIAFIRRLNTLQCLRFQPERGDESDLSSQLSSSGPG